MLTFDEEQEKDIIQLIESLNSSHKTGQFISNLIRLAVDNPELLEVQGGRYRSKSIALDYIERVGMSNNRRLFMDSMKNEVNTMKNKVDKIYEMTLNLMTLAQMNKYLELDNKSKNIMTANFILEKQLKELQDILGTKDSVFASNKIQDVEKIANEALEFIIESYDGIVKEFKQQVEVQTVTNVQTAPVEVQTIPVQPIIQPVQQFEQTVTPVTQPVTQPSVEQPKVEKTVTEDDTEIIDFGSADTNALLSFFGNS